MSVSLSRYDPVWRAAEPYMRARKNDVHIPLSFAWCVRLLDHFPDADRDVCLLAILLHDIGWWAIDMEEIIEHTLEKLVELGMVHRLESLNAFVACRHPGCESHETIAFAICDSCGQVREIGDADLGARLRVIARQAGFRPARSVVEMHGLCRNCQSG